MKNKKGEILVVGSVVRDITYLPNNKIKESHGGTGTNIAFGLGVLGALPILVSVAGIDFDKQFKDFLKINGINAKIFKFEKEKTAVFQVTIEQNGKETFNWCPNVFNNIENIKLTSLLSEKEINKIKIAIFSPGTPKSTTNHMVEFNEIKNSGALSIFDPGQMTGHYKKVQLEKCIKFCDIFILNELEFKQANYILKKDLLKLFKNKTLIKTLGGQGSELYEKGQKIFIPIAKPKQIVSTVGAGDAYRAGLIYGISNKMVIEDACKLGAKFSAKSVEKVGCHRSFFKV